MKVAESVLAMCVLGLAGFIGAQTAGVRSVLAHAEAAGAIDGRAAPRTDDPRASRASRARADDELHGAPVETLVDLRNATSHILGSPVATAPRLFADKGVARDMRRHIAAGAPGTYIDELLVARDSALARWSDRIARPLRVWVDDPATMSGWDVAFPESVRAAFNTWSETGIPVRFDFIRDSTSADIHVRFIERLANGISGKTVWSRDANWWLVSSDIQLALVHPSGGIVTAPQMRAIALHEVGHLLGLDHASAVDNIMCARVRVRALSDADRATVRLLYSMPAGSVK